MTTRTATLRLQRTPQAAGQARRKLARLCRQLSQDRRDTAALLTSELVTNAVVHGAGFVTLAMECDGRFVAVAVGDESDDQPVIRIDQTDSPDGRGLQLVRSLAAAWGVRPSRNGPGKVVWFRL